MHRASSPTRSQPSADVTRTVGRMTADKHDETPLERSEHAIDEAKEAAAHFHATDRESVMSQGTEVVAEEEDAEEHEPAPEGPDEPAPGA
jgi:hypothetical protein